MSSFAAAFVPLLVAMDAPGAVPTFLQVTSELDAPTRRALAGRAVLAGAATGLGFLVAGEAVFRTLGIVRADFRVAGGLVLIALALTELLRRKEIGRSAPDELAVVPLGIPLIVGPGTLAAIVALADQEGAFVTALAFGANLLLARALLVRASRISAFLGAGGMRALSKVMNLLLAAIAVSMLRAGLQEILAPVAAASR